MSTKHNSPCLAKAADDEPIFVLRAKDPTAPDIIRDWIYANRDLQPSAKRLEAEKLAEEMKEWRRTNITS